MFSSNTNPGPLQDQRVQNVLTRMNSERKRPTRAIFSHDAEAFADVGFSIAPEQGDLIYLMCRALKARRVVDFATSVGMSALYFAAAVRDNGGGQVIGSELVAKKAETARRNLTEAGLETFVDIRVGDARETLKDLGGEVDFVLIDGWPGNSKTSLARDVIGLVAPQLRVGGMVMNDNAEEDFLAFIRDPANGFISISLPIKRGTELALKIR